MKWFFPSLFLFLLLVLWLFEDAVNAFVEFVTMFLYLSLAAGVLAVLLTMAIIWKKVNVRIDSKTDGSRSLRRIRYGGPLWWLGLGWHTKIIDLDKYPGFEVSINYRTGEVTTDEPSYGWEAQLHWATIQEVTDRVRSIVQGDLSRSHKYGALSKSGNLSAAALRVLGKNDPSPDAALAQLPGSSFPSVTLDGAAHALQIGERDRWPIGQSGASGRLAMFEPTVHAHGGIIGKTRSGKTRTGFLLAAHAIRAQYGVTILDPDGGEEWGRFFGGCAEVVHTDRNSIHSQVRALYDEYERRRPDDSSRPSLIIIDEFGSQYKRLKHVDATKAKDVDRMLDEIFQRGGKKRMHIVVIDQYPDEWSPQVVSGTSAFLAVFRMGPNQGSKVKVYKADEPGYLAPRGQFVLEGEVYNSWEPDAQFIEQLGSMPADIEHRLIPLSNSIELPSNAIEPLSHWTEPIEPGQRERAKPPPPTPPFDVRSAPKYDVIRWWIDHVGGDQSEFHSWASVNGFVASKGYVSDVFTGRFVPRKED